MSVQLVNTLRNDEIWKPVVDFEGLYEVSDYGHIRSVDRYITTTIGLTRFVKGKIKSLQVDSKTGYVSVRIFKNSKCFVLYSHRAVAEAFIGPISKGMCVNHIDGVKFHNHVSNLEITTPKENCQHAGQNGLGYFTGEFWPLSKLTIEQAKEIRAAYLSAHVSQRKLAKQYGVSQKAIYNIIHHKSYFRDYKYDEDGTIIVEQI